jgi:hypothetical protein
MRNLLGKRQSGVLLSASLLFAATALPASAATVGLRVLVITGGNQETSINGTCVSYVDPGLDLMTGLLKEMLVPYDVYYADSNQLMRGNSVITTSPMTAQMLADSTNGKYNGVILTDSSALGLVAAGSCNGGYESKMDAAEWDALHDYESTFGVREAVVSGSLWPWVSGYALDYGMDATAPFIWQSVGATTAGWLSPAGGTQFFEYIKRETPLTLDGGFAWVGKPKVQGTVPSATAPVVVQSLLAARNGTTTDRNKTMIGIARYAADPANGRPNVREVLVSGIGNASYLIYSQVLAYEFVNFATKGVFAGGRYASLTAHNDDLFLPNDLWDPACANPGVCSSPDYVPPPPYRITDADFNNAVTAQRNLMNKYGTIRQFKLELAFNGSGTTTTYGGLPENTATDLLTNAVRANVSGGNDFRYINHTWRHWDNDITANVQPCLAWLDDTATVPPYASEITLNRTAWQKLGLPQRTQNNVVMVPGDHSGLKDDGCEMSGQGISPPYNYDAVSPPGRNGDFLTALYGAGIRGAASDSSQPAQGEEKYDPSGILLLPRRPANVFFNVTQPGTSAPTNPASGAVGDLVSEYNYIFWKRLIDMGQDPCATPGAICQPRTYAEILKAEVESALRHILSYREWSFFFHQSNLKNYGGGKTLQYDWLDAVVGAYDKVFKLPLKSPLFFQIATNTANRVKARQATIDGYVDIDAAGNPTVVHIGAASGGPVTMLVTGVSGSAALYGGQSVQSVTLTGSGLQVFNVNRAL